MRGMEQGREGSVYLYVFPGLDFWGFSVFV